MVKKIFKKVIKEVNLLLPVLSTQNEIEKVFIFFRDFQSFRSLENCSKLTNLSILKCARIKKYLYKKRKIGLYYFEASAPPHKYMCKFILDKFPKINKNSCILEVGPGEYPVFSFEWYNNWYGIDCNYDGEFINFKENKWAKNLYPKDRIFKGSFEDLIKVFEGIGLIKNFDLIVGSHSFEHTSRPIESLKQMCSMLKVGGVLVLFVPDLYTDDINSKDPTHTLYINKEMMLEFFDYAGGFGEINISTFRPNADLVITAVKV